MTEMYLTSAHLHAELESFRQKFWDELLEEMHKYSKEVVATIDHRAGFMVRRAFTEQTTIEFFHIEGREFGVRQTFHSKMYNKDFVKETRCRLPIPVYRGVWEPDQTYEAGDNVTYAGSLWIARRMCTGVRPDGADAWQLAVKKGRDGRDANAKARL